MLRRSRAVSQAVPHDVSSTLAARLRHSGSARDTSVPGSPKEPQRADMAAFHVIWLHADQSFMEDMLRCSMAVYMYQQAVRHDVASTLAATWQRPHQLGRGVPGSPARS